MTNSRGLLVSMVQQKCGDGSTWRRTGPAAHASGGCRACPQHTHSILLLAVTLTREGHLKVALNLKAISNN